MAKKSKKKSRQPRGDKYATQAAAAQQERVALNKKYEEAAKKELELARSSKLLHSALGDWEEERQSSVTDDERPIMFLPTEHDLLLRQFDRDIMNNGSSHRNLFAHDLGLKEPQKTWRDRVQTTESTLEYEMIDDLIDSGGSL